MRLSQKLIVVAGAAIAFTSAPALAQDSNEVRAVQVRPYIEASQILSVALTPGDDVLTYTQLAAGVDANAQGQYSGVSVSVRYERNIGYGDALDSDTISGVARGYLSVVPRALQFEGGALASRTRLDGGAVSPNPLVSADATSQIYSVYAGPSISTHLDSVKITGSARVGYNRFESNDAAVGPDGTPFDVFDDSVTYNGQVVASTRAGDPFTVGLAITAGVYQEDISNLDQRVRDSFVRGDATIPLSQSFAVVGGIGYEDVEVSSRDATRDADGNPVFGRDGRLEIDSSSPRLLAFDIDGLLWDVGVLWRPSSRTSLSARVGERYDSTTYYGSFTYTPNVRSTLAVAVYDGVSGLGGTLNNSLAALSSDFVAQRNPVTGDFGGLVTNGTNDEPGIGLVNSLGSIRSAAFRGRGINASYQRQIGRITAALGVGYDRRTFIAAPGSALEAIDGVSDESYYVTGALDRQLDERSNLQTNAYVNWFETGTANGDLTAIGASAAYNRSITAHLSARAAIALDYFDSDFTDEDFATATALLGLRYDF